VDGLVPSQRSQKPSQTTIRVSGPLPINSLAQPALPPSSATTSKPVVRAGSAALRAETTSNKPNKKKRKRAEDGEDFLNDTGMRNGTPITKGHGHKEHKSKKAKHDDHDLRVRVPERILIDVSLLSSRRHSLHSDESNRFSKNNRLVGMHQRGSTPKTPEKSFTNTTDRQA
jgi:hypothetical protein